MDSDVSVHAARTPRRHRLPLIAVHRWLEPSSHMYSSGTTSRSLYFRLCSLFRRRRSIWGPSRLPTEDASQHLDGCALGSPLGVAVRFLNLNRDAANLPADASR